MSEPIVVAGAENLPERVPVEVAVGVLVERDADGREGRFLLTSRPAGTRSVSMNSR